MTQDDQTGFRGGNNPVRYFKPPKPFAEMTREEVEAFVDKIHMQMMQYAPPPQTAKKKRGKGK